MLKHLAANHLLIPKLQIRVLLLSQTGKQVRHYNYKYKWTQKSICKFHGQFPIRLIRHLPRMGFSSTDGWKLIANTILWTTFDSNPEWISSDTLDGVVNGGEISQMQLLDAAELEEGNYLQKFTS